MKKRIVILAFWNNKNQFKSLKEQVEGTLQGDFDFNYLLLVKRLSKNQELPYIPNVNYVSKKDFSLFGKLKHPKTRALLQKKDGFLISLITNNEKLSDKIIKITQLKTVGIENKALPKFEIAFKNTTASSSDLLEKINNYIAKIIIV